jgi:hypothetical protein
MPAKATGHDVGELGRLERVADYDALIEGLRERVQSDRRAVTNRWVKGWCGRRWRNLFLTEAAKDQRAVRVASRRFGIAGTGRPGAQIDRRPVRQRLAERFLSQNQDDWRLELPDTATPRRPRTTLVFCPGLVSTLVPAEAFGRPLPAIQERYGLKVVRATSHPVRGCEANVPDLLDAIDRGRGLDAAGAPIRRPRRPREVVLLGYSKGTPDALTLLATRPEVAPRVRALVCWAGAVGGSYMADGLEETMRDLDRDLGPAAEPLLALVRVLLPVARLDRVADRFDEWDLRGAVRDLTTTERARFLRRHRKALDELDLPIFNVATVAGRLEVPYFQLQGAVDIGRRAGDNDMQLSVKQSCMTTPMATTLAVLHAHHWDVTYDPFPRRVRLTTPNLDHPFPREAALTATVLLLSELGLLD